VGRIAVLEACGHTGHVSRRSRVIWIASATFWTCVGLACGLQIWISMISHGHALWRVLAYQVLIWNAWLAFSPLIARLARRFSLVPPTPGALAVHVGAAIAIALVHSAWWAILLVVIRPYDAMGSDDFVEAYTWIAPSGLVQQLIYYCCVLAAHYAVVYYDKYRERERAALRFEMSLVEAKLHALDLQLRPHFLFNTLNSISALVRVARQSEATQMIAGLSELLRYSLEHSGEQQVSLASELAITERYLEIERLRFPDRMAFAIEADADTRSARVPTLLLQPLVENAIRHGIAPVAAPGRISIRAFRDDTRLRIEIFNTGALAAERTMGVGQRNTMERLRHVYGDDHTFELRAETGGVLAAVAVPWKVAA
jgi:two-component system, LytTR family, sensor kinase